jgi:serine/threonine-protein kinase
MGSVQPGQQLDHYSIEREIAQSGMATIYLGKDLRTGCQVAIKVPHLEAECDVAFFERFQREEQIGQKLDHPGVVKVFRNDGRSRLYMVMEWVEGKSLRTLLNEQRKLTPDRAVAITLQICNALEYLHRNGVIHRDLKPENIILDSGYNDTGYNDSGDHVKLIDFGIAGCAGARRLTFGKLSNTMGTPDYISPEQVQGKRGDARSDLFALGVMLYEMLTGRVPFQGSNPLAVMNARLRNNPVPPRQIEPAIPSRLQTVIYRALERDHKNRYATAKDFADGLAHLDETGVDEPSGKPAENPPHMSLSWLQGALFFGPLALIPMLIFTLLFYFSRHP